jgi:membrane-bound serine protease (ClpP class)
MFILSILAVAKMASGSAFGRLRNVSVSPGRVEYEDTAELARKPKIGARGVALTPLRPSGTAVINDQRYDVVTEGVMVERDAAVEVVDVEGNVVTVAPV